MTNRSSIYRWAGIAFAGFTLLICCSFLIYNTQKPTCQQTEQVCASEKKKNNKMVWEDLSSRFFSPSEKNSEKTPG